MQSCIQWAKLKIKRTCIMPLTFRFKRNYINNKIKYKIIGIFVTEKKAMVLKSN